MNWINIIVPVVSSIVAVICYRLGAKAGYARGHEAGRTAGATELAERINGLQGNKAACKHDWTKRTRISRTHRCPVTEWYCVKCNRVADNIAEEA